MTVSIRFMTYYLSIYIFVSLSFFFISRITLGAIYSNIRAMLLSIALVLFVVPRDRFCSSSNPFLTPGSHPSHLPGASHSTTTRPSGAVSGACLDTTPALFLHCLRRWWRHLGHPWRHLGRQWRHLCYPRHRHRQKRHLCCPALHRSVAPSTRQASRQQIANYRQN